MSETKLEEPEKAKERERQESLRLQAIYGGAA